MLVTDCGGGFSTTTKVVRVGSVKVKHGHRHLGRVSPWKLFHARSRWRTTRFHHRDQSIERGLASGDLFTRELISPIYEEKECSDRCHKTRISSASCRSKTKIKRVWQYGSRMFWVVSLFSSCKFIRKSIFFEFIKKTKD